MLAPAIEFAEAIACRRSVSPATGVSVGLFTTNEESSVRSSRAIRIGRICRRCHCRPSAIPRLPLRSALRSVANHGSLDPQGDEQQLSRAFTRVNDIPRPHTANELSSNLSSSLITDLSLISGTWRETPVCFAMCFGHERWAPRTW